MKINETKLLVPDLPCMQRDRLFRLLDNHLHRSLVTITSEGGYGKTTFMSNYIRQQQRASMWYRLDSNDQNPRIFLSYLKKGLSSFISTLSSDISLELEQEVEALSMKLSAHKEPLLIVLDDYQMINDQAELANWMAKLIESASPQVTFILLSRVKPSLPLIRFKLKQQLGELYAEDLAFDQHEALSYFSTFSQLSLTIEDIQTLIRKTEGWVTSLVLLADLMKRMNEVDRRYYLARLSITEDIYLYMESEIFEQQQQKVQQFLLQICLMDELDPLVINDFLGIEGSAQLLDYLHTNHLFILREKRGYRFHRLFRMFLYQRLKKEIDEKEFRLRHIQLAQVYETRHSLMKAFAHYTWGKDYIQAARLMRLMVKRFHPELFLAVADGLLEALTPDNSLATTSLFIFRCVPLSILEKLVPIFEKNLASINPEDRSLLNQVQHRLAHIYFYRGELNDSKALFEASLEGALQCYDLGLVALNYSMISQIYRFMGDEAKAIEYARYALSYAEEHSIPPHVKMHALWNLAEVSIMKKDLHYAESLTRESLTVSEQCDEASKAYPLSTMGKIYRERGEYNEAMKWGREALEHAVRFEIEPDLGWTSLELGITYLHAGMLDEAETSLMKAYQIFDLYSDVHQVVRRWIRSVQEQRYLSANPPPTQVEKVPNLQVNLLGTFQLLKGGQPLGIPRKSSLRLFLFLLTNRGRRLAKDVIIDALFPEDSFDTVQNKFYVSLSVLRKSLEPDLLSGRNSKYIKQEGDQFFISTEEMFIDAEKFIDLTGKEGDDGLQSWLHAESLYQGDFLNEFPYESFLEIERESLTQTYLNLLEKIATCYADVHQYEKTVEYLERILKKDPYRDYIYVKYAEVLLEQKRYSQLKQLVLRAKKYLEEELDIRVDLLFGPLLEKYNATQPSVRLL
ncbi:tetratricopeptide repeat protein [Ammoniphilus sp. CFH 90114]|uniref:tetratricopeptide repeat protein n=1 Tax=Ammoniphilus sp. CFH 90114 TaxID=2493665 RepID=UPI00100F6580|nr:tetratricopeptide repeat protein [Ammoniphilus sp. CFH 90114]RXT06957.1 hypothetical protein EIZ39_12405 [Ammoniphilus sp. CFH 90114]